MRYYTKLLLFTLILFYISVSCEKFNEQDKFKRPDWLPGKLYTTILAQENLTLFAECLQLSGLDTILDVSGSWSVFAPTNEAIKQYLSENQYANISSIPLIELEKITKFHVVQNPWSLEQLQSLSAYGWRARNDANLYSYAYKRQTILKNTADKYWIKKLNSEEKIVLDSTKSDSYKKVFVQSRKNVPIFYDDFININGISSSDYQFYFDRAYEPGNVYYAGAKILQADIFAENGFLHIVDRVVNPMLNAKEFLERELPGETYKLFLEMIFWYYPSFEPNMIATYNQPAVRMGGIVDTLWDLNYTDLAFIPHEERIGYEGPNINESFVRHNGLFVPTDDAFIKFVDDILTVKSGFPHWNDLKSLPIDIVEIIIPPHFKASPIYPSSNQYQEIFNESGKFRLEEENIIRKEFGSNCTFIGLNNYVPDKVFTSVTGPVFLRPGYSIFRQALLYSGIEDDIAYNNNELKFFPIPDKALKSDSSLLINWIDRDENRYSFSAYDRERRQMVSVGRSTIRNMILNHVGTTISNGTGDLEIIRTLRGNNITWDHSNNTIRGSRPSIYGLNGKTIVTCIPVELEEPADNGKSWSVNYWFKF